MTSLPGWWQLARFGTVGASGYVVNLATFALATHALGLPYRLAAVAAFLVAVASNYWWNRRWTFRPRGPVALEATRFLVVSVGAFALALLGLDSLAAATTWPKLADQAISIVAVAPLSFLANRRWVFAEDALRVPGWHRSVSRGAPPDGCP